LLNKALATYCVGGDGVYKYGEKQHSLMFYCFDKASSAISVGLFSLATLYTVLTVGHNQLCYNKAAIWRNWHVCERAPWM